MRSRAQLAFAALVLACPILALDARLDAGLAQGASGRALTWARAVEAPTLDPHAVNDGAAPALAQQIYEPLLQRDQQGKTQPALAVSWTPTSDPLVWEFRLRQGVTFHDGAPFSSEDVIFSIERARQRTSEFAAVLAIVDNVSKVDAATIRIKTRVATTLLPAHLTRILMMSKAWAEANNVHHFDWMEFGGPIRNQIPARRLRVKIEADVTSPALIKTERGAGYVLACPVETLY